MCRIPAGSGFGGRKARVIIGEKVVFGRNLVRRWFTGMLEFSNIDLVNKCCLVYRSE